MDFTKMRWRVDQVELEKDIASFYPELYENMQEQYKKVMPTLTSNGMTMNLFLRYLVLCYHQFSPYALTIDDIVVRKRKVLMALDINNSEHFLLKPPTQEIAYAILQFLKFEDNPKHKKLMMYQEAQAKNYIDLVEGSTNERAKVPDLIESIDRLIKNLSATYSKGDMETMDYAESFEVIANRKIFPEEQ